jgi:CHASE2 domain-containing sensor protein
MGRSYPSTRIFLVGGSEDDIADFDWPLTDEQFAELLERIASWKPRAIGVGIYRDKPKPPGTERLTAVLARHKEIVWTFKLSSLDDKRGPYTRLDSSGYQILVDYFGGANPFPLRRIGEIMRSDDLASLVRGRVVIVGVSSESVHDSFSTPFNTGFNSGDQMRFAMRCG